MREHRKLRAFELADQLVMSVYSATRTFPKDEVFGLTSQLRRASVSIASKAMVFVVLVVVSHGLAP